MNLNDLYLVRDALDTALTGGGNDSDIVDALQLIENGIQEYGTADSVPVEVDNGNEDNEVSDSGDNSENDVVETVGQTVSFVDASQV